MSNKTDNMGMYDWDEGSDPPNQEQCSSNINDIDNEFGQRGINIQWKGADPEGIADSSTAMLAAISTDTDTIYLPKGVYLINQNITLPRSAKIVFDRGARLKIANGKKLTINGAIEAHSHNYIFDLSSGGIISGTPLTSSFYPHWFGAIGDGIADDTTAMQYFFDFVVNNSASGVIPTGTYKLTRTINVSSGGGWRISGTGFRSTKLKQFSNNIPILNMGYNGGSTACSEVIISEISFEYATPQTSIYQNGSALFFSTSYYQCSFTKLRFEGWYGIKHKPNEIGSWGCVFDELIFTAACYGGAMDWTGMKNAIPNNRFGRMLIDGKNMAGPIFNGVKGHNWTIDILEFLQTNQGAQLMSFQAGSICTIGAIKLENGMYNAAQNLINMDTGCKIKIGQINISGNAMYINPATGVFNLFKTSSGGDTGWLEIDVANISATSLSGNVYILEGKGGSITIKNLNTNGNNFVLQNGSSTSSSDSISISDWNNNRLSGNKGDADYTITLGDPNNISFETPLTTPRIVNLPGENNNLFNGLRYRIRAYGAINGLNNITIKCNNAVVATLSSDKSVIEIMYRHVNYNPQDGWIVVGYNTLP